MWSRAKCHFTERHFSYVIASRRYQNWPTIQPKCCSVEEVQLVYRLRTEILPAGIYSRITNISTLFPKLCLPGYHSLTVVNAIVILIIRYGQM